MTFVFVNREYRYSMGGDEFYLKRRRYSSTNRNLAVILPIIALIVIAGAGAIVFIYYKKIRGSRSASEKSSGATRRNENYSGKYTIANSYVEVCSLCLAVPQETPVEQPIPPPRRQPPEPPAET